MAQQPESKSPDKNEDPGFTALSVSGFKSLREESRIEIRPLTVLAGANSSGKSSMMQPLLLLKQTVEASYDPGLLLLNGPNAKFTSVNEFRPRWTQDSNGQPFAVQIEKVAFDFSIKWVFDYEEDSGVTLKQVNILEDGRSLRLRHSQGPSQIKRAIAGFFGDIDWPKGLQLQITRDRCMLQVEPKQPTTKEDLTLPHARVLFFTRIFSEVVRRRLGAVIHVPGLRGNPERGYPRTGSGPTFPGAFQNYVATIVAHWQEEGNKEQLRALETMLSDLGLTRKVLVRAIDDSTIELRIGRLPHSDSATDLVSIADVGLGVSQVLPVLVALLVAEHGQTVYIEQPELHLHPRAQYTLGKMLAETAKRGVKLVVETHSGLLLLSVQTLVAQGTLDSELVKLHWFTRDSENGMTDIHSANLDEDGAFADWPEDFGDVELRAEGEYLDAVESRGK